MKNEKKVSRDFLEGLIDGMVVRGDLTELDNLTLCKIHNLISKKNYSAPNGNSVTIVYNAQLEEV